MDYRIYIDNTLINDSPMGLEDIVLSIERDKQFDATFYKYGSPLTFVGDGYDDLKAKYDASFCGNATLLIQSKCDPEGDYVTIFDGIIQLSKCQFNLTKCSVDVTLSDDTISAKIANNWRVSGIINTDRSIEQSTITAASDVDLDFFTPSTGTYDKTNRMAFSVYEAFQWLVAYMTDNTVQFASNTFGGGGTYEYWYILTGLALRDTTNETAPNISFYDLYTELNKIIPLGFWVEDNAGTPRIRIEERGYFYNNTNEATMRNIGGDGLIAKVAEDQLFAKVEMGTQIFTRKNDDGGPFTFPDNEFFGWSPQEYGFTIGCNIDNDLDLRTKLICDNNTIEDILINSNDDYDDAIVLTVGEEYSLGAFRAIKYTAGTGGDPYYNEPTTQYQVAQRWQTYIPGSFSKWLQLTSVDDQCEVNIGADQGPYTVTTSKAAVGTFDPYPFDNEVFDNGGNFNTTTFRYVCPNNGLYGVRANVNFRIGNAPFNTQTTVFVTIREYPTGGGTPNDTLIASETYVNRLFVETLNIELTGSFLSSATDYIDVLIEAQTDTSTSEITILSTTTFEVTTAPGTVVEFIQTERPRIKQYEFTYPMSDSTWRALKANPNRTITINPEKDTANDIVCWIQRIDYEPSKGIANLTLISQ